MPIRIAIACLAAVLVAGAAFAQDAEPSNSPPARIGNIYNGTAHEPNPAAVTANEKAAGVALPPGASRADTKSIEGLDQRVQQNGASSVGSAKSLACSTVPATCR